MKRFVVHFAMLMCTLLMSSPHSVVFAMGTGDGWRETIIPGVYEEIPEPQRGSSDYMPFRCYPPWDSFCARIMWKPLDKDGRLGSAQPDATDRVALWIPQKGIGYTDVRLNGISVDLLTQSAIVQVSGTGSTQVVSSMTALEDWLKSIANPE